MGVGYELVNITKKERIAFYHIGVLTKSELAGNPIASAITTWYLLENCGDQIAFVPDHYNLGDEEWPFTDVSWQDIRDYREITDEIVYQLITRGVIRDDGKKLFAQEEPGIYIRKLVNVWMGENL